MNEGFVSISDFSCWANINKIPIYLYVDENKINFIELCCFKKSDPSIAIDELKMIIKDM